MHNSETRNHQMQQTVIVANVEDTLLLLAFSTERRLPCVNYDGWLLTYYYARRQKHTLDRFAPTPSEPRSGVLFTHDRRLMRPQVGV